MYTRWLSLLIAGAMLVVCGCRRTQTTAVGIAEIASVLAAADAAVLHGNVQGVQEHTDFASVPPGIVELLRGSNDGPTVTDKLRLKSRALLSPKDYDRALRDRDALLPEYMRGHSWPSKWNISPEKFIVYTFEPTNRAAGNSDVWVTLGVFQRSGLWFFAVDYYPFEGRL